jgi:hypothetical protein
LREAQRRIGVSADAGKDFRFLSVGEFKDLEAKTLEIQRMLAAPIRRLGPPILAGSQQLEASSSCE